jgi:hypothetical protein
VVSCYDPKEKQITGICMVNVKSWISTLLNMSVNKGSSKKEGFTMDQILSFQNGMDEFAHDLLWLYGNNVMTNYIFQLIGGPASVYKRVK